jgi:hypothetical protein
VLHTVVLSMLAATLQQDSIIATVRTAAEREPIEVFGNAKGSVRIRDVRLLDVDGDGSLEAFVWIDPSVRQTPTILVYTYDPRTGPHRILEGLVAGQLRPVSGRFVDDHTMGFGVDLSVDRFDDRLITAAVKNGMSLVRYKTFVHSDGRNGFVTFVDLSDRALPRPETKTCEAFEFGLVEGLAAGTLSGSAGVRYLVALTATDITIYRFHRIRPNGTLDKEVWIQNRPPLVTGLAVTSNGQVELRTRDGSSTALTAPR